jgi:hypothetical protein
VSTNKPVPSEAVWLSAAVTGCVLSVKPWYVEFMFSHGWKHDKSTFLLFDVHVTMHHDKFLTIKPTRCTNYSNLFLEWNSACFRQFLCPPSGVFYCTHSNGVCHTGLLTACELGFIIRNFYYLYVCWGRGLYFINTTYLYLKIMPEMISTKFHLFFSYMADCPRVLYCICVMIPHI